MKWYRILSKITIEQGKPFEERPLQKMIVDELQKRFEELQGRLTPILVRLPCGYGKTQIGESPFLGDIYSENWITRGLVYVLPTRSLTDQQRDRIKDDVEKLCEIKGIKKLTTEALHGEANTYYFYADAIVSTFDVFTYAYARKSRTGHHIEFPAGTIATSYMVFDEAHMIQDEYLYSHAVLNKIMLALVDSGIPVIVMTATMPKPIKEVIFDGIEYEELPKLEDIKTGKLPAMNTYRGKLSDIQIHKESIVNYIRKAFSANRVKGKRILIVCNTVREAQEIFETINEKLGKEVKSYGKILLLHSRLVRGDRKRRSDIAIKLMKPNNCEKCDKKCNRLPIFISRKTQNDYCIYCDECGPSEHARRIDFVILVATQVVEAGLDITSDWLLTDCAPLDALTQRAGRCARFLDEQGTIDIFYHNEVYRPYSKDLVEGVYKILRREDPIRCLTDFIESSYLIDENYEVFKRIIPQERLRSYLSYLEGHGFSTFSVNWRLLRWIEARPNAFLNLVVFPIDTSIPIYELIFDQIKLKYGRFQIADVSLKATYLTYKALLTKIKNKKNIALSNDFICKHSFTLSRPYAIKGAGKKRPREFLCHEINGKKILLELRPVLVKEEEGKLTRDYYYLIEQATGRVNETTYLLSPIYYDNVLGLKIDGDA